MRTHSSCPLCNGPTSRRPLTGREDSHRIACPRCGTFVVESTLPSQPWARLRLEDMRLIVFLPTYIRDCNRCNHTPLLTLENWRAHARRGRLLAWEHPEAVRAAEGAFFHENAQYFLPQLPV